MGKEYTLRISRYNPEVDDAPVLKEYRVPYVEQDSVLGALLHIYEEIDSTLLFNYGCRYRICGKCAIKINGRPGLACETPVEDEMVLEPLDGLPVIRDLAVDRSSVMELLRTREIFFSPGKALEVVVQPPEFLSLMRCNECLSCLSACPVFRQKLGYDGPLFGTKLAQLHYDVRESRKLLDQLDSFLDLCIQCKRCDVSCPWDVRFSEVSSKIKGELFRERGASIRDRLLSRPASVGVIASLLSSPVNALTKKKMVRKLMDRMIRLDERAPFPEYHLTQRRGAREKTTRADRRAAFFMGCYHKYNDPFTAEDCLAVLSACGTEAEVLDLGCCGIPFLGIGDLESAKKRAVEISAGLKKWVENGYDIVLACPSCTSMIKNEYPALFNILGEPSIQERILDLGEYLVRMRESGQWTLKFKDVRRTVGYQVSCHLRALRIGTPFVDLLRSIPGLEVRRVFDDCCGMAGTLGFKKEKHDLSEKVGKPLMEDIRKSQLDWILSDCASCQMKIKHETKATTLHPIRILREALG